MIASVLHSFGRDSLSEEMKELFINGTDSQKAYSAKYFTFTPEFAKEFLILLKNDPPEQIEMFYQFNKQGFCTLFPE